MWLLLLPSVLAHVPHDVVTAVAPAPGLDPGRPWWLVANHDEVSDLYRSDDGGRTWQATSGACLVDRIRAAATLDDGDVVLLGDGRLWWGGPEGGWAEVPLGFSPTGIAGGDRLTVGADDGVWTVGPDGAAAQLWTGGSVSGLHAGAGGIVAFVDGGVLVGRGADWEVIPALPGGMSATLDADAVYVGDAAGAVWRWDGDGWGACGIDPLVGEDPGHPEVVQLVSDGTTLALAHADAGPALSTDGCATWTADPAPVDLVWQDELDPDDYYDYTELDEAFTALAASGDRRLVAGYDGPAAAAGGVWSKSPLKGGDYPRAAAFSTDFATDGRALVAAYGCGVAAARAGGAEWTCAAAGLTKPAVQKVLIPVDADGLVPAYALSDRVPVRSDDGGASWVSLAGDFGPAHDMAVGPGGRVWLFPVQEIAGGAPGDTLRSDDGGGSWHGVAGLAVVGDHPVGGVVDDGGRVVVYTADRDETTAETLYLSDDGETFGADHVMAGIADVTSWPGDPDRVIAVGPEGIDVRRDGKWSRMSTIPTRRVVCTSDGTLLAATRTQRILRSTDGGDAWSDIGAQLAGQVEALAANPDFAAHPELVVMTPAGAFRVGVDGAVARWMGLEQVDDQSHYEEFVTYDPPTSDIPRAGAALGSVHALAAGSTATVWLRGTSVVLLGAVEGEAALELHVDGEVTVGEVRDVPLGGVLARVDGLAEGLHEVTLGVTRGDGVVLDAAQGIEASAPLTFGGAATAPCPRGCGCGGGNATSAAVGVLLAWRMRRGRREVGRVLGASGRRIP